MFAQALSRAAAAVHSRLDTAIGDLPGGDLQQAMIYATRGGKGLRGFLVIEGARLHGLTGSGSGPLNAAAAVEALHAYSLVHDDLPCMDDDDLRRGQPTVHVKWDQATAVLAGDALQTLAFQLLAQPDTAADPAIRVDLIARLAQASGAAGMVHGQALDIAAETAETPLDLDQITRLQAAKTGALIEWSGTAGAILAGADPAPLMRYSQALGLAFQLADDILDIEGDAEAAGKRLRKDASAGKATFVSLLGLDGARARARDLVAQAEDALHPYGDDARILRDAARFVIERDS